MLLISDHDRADDTVSYKSTALSLCLKNGILDQSCLPFPDVTVSESS